MKTNSSSLYQVQLRESSSFSLEETENKRENEEVAILLWGFLQVYKSELYMDISIGIYFLLLDKVFSWTS